MFVWGNKGESGASPTGVKPLKTGMQERLAGTAALCGFNLAFVLLDACLARRILSKLRPPTPLKWRGNQDPDPFLVSSAFCIVRYTQSKMKTPIDHKYNPPTSAHVNNSGKIVRRFRKI
jgi:hypothetical protein